MPVESVTSRIERRINVLQEVEAEEGSRAGEMGSRPPEAEGGSWPPATEDGSRLPPEEDGPRLPAAGDGSCLPAVGEPLTGPAPPGPSRPSRAAGRMRRRVAGVLLALVSAGYFAVAADQSHNVTAAREISAELAGLATGPPSPVQQAVYRVPVPVQAENVAFFEANSWTKDTLYVRFTTTRAGLADFLRQIGAGPDDLRAGRRGVVVPASDAAKVPWTFPAGHHWAGLTEAAARPRPSRAITVDLDTPDRPTVYAASVIRFPSH